MYHHTNDSDERRNSGGMSASELDIENGCTTGRLRVAVNHTDETVRFCHVFCFKTIKNYKSDEPICS
jgi:hypothetical protein